MKRYELEIEHHYKNKFVGRHRITPSEDMVVLGQSRSANIRLLGEDVSQIHALIEFADGAWFLVDVGSESGTWVKKKPITSEVLKTATTVNIGGHTLKLTPRLIEGGLFTEERMAQESRGSKLFHQVILRKRSLIIRSELLGANEAFSFQYENRELQLPPPKVGETKSSDFGDVTIQQRLVSSDDTKVTMADRLHTLTLPEMRTPLGVALVLVLFISGLLIFMPKAPDAELAELKKDNTYTRMIYDANLLKKKRTEAQERKVIAKKSGNTSGGGSKANDPTTTPVQSKGDTPKVVSKIKGLSTLMGKISQRANVKSVQIAGAGRRPADTNAAGKMNLAAVGSLQGVATQVGNGGEVFRVAGIGTFGKGGGGTGALGAIGALNSGNAGNASVGILDDETEIEGGLDRDVIARIIQNHLGEIRYCYERQLSAEPDLYGKVQVKFTIDGTGIVADQRVGVTTLKNAIVEGCILRRMARWKFPQPKGGTHVLVTYPFMFKSTN